MTGPSDQLYERFDELARRWTGETLVMSSSTQIFAHDAYRQIVDLGEQALPVVLTELQRSGDVRWVQALTDITGIRQPATGAGPAEVVQAWLAWGRAQDFAN